MHRGGQGLFLGRAREVRRILQEKERILLGLGAAVTLHGTYNFVLTMDGLYLLHIPLLIAGLGYGLKRISRAMIYSP
ncbi:TPA: hypothetical protein DCE37_03170 [Candidatus Latescibacteria bacterium]|nr:hypothetical protein [Candidatus Latescibacterota bacterium]